MDRAQIDKIAAMLCESSGWAAPRYIAHGNSAAVYEVDHPKHGQTALKVYDPSFFEGSNALIETQRISLQEDLKDHGNPNLIEIIEAKPIPESQTWYLLMEFCPWPTLEEQILLVPPERIHGLIKQLVSAVLFLEEKLLIHRDIKPANIAVSPNFDQLKLLDLGVMRRIEPQEGNGTDGGGKKRFIATAQYGPPEYLTRDELPGMEGFAAINLYQVGAVLHDMIMKEPIFDQEASTGNKFILYKAVTTKKPRVFSQEVPARLLAICNSALQKDPERRIGAVKLTDLLADIDDADAIRRRVGSLAGVGVAEAASPSLLVWERRVRDWIRAASRRERDTLGAFSIHRQAIGTGIEWLVTFADLNRVALFELLITDAEALILQIVAQTTTPVRLTILEIGPDGTGITDDEVVGLIAEHILYAIDLAAADDAGDEPSPERAEA